MFSAVTRLINAKFLLKITHVKRAMFVSVCMLISFLLVSLCCYDPKGLQIFFWFSLMASIMQGASCALGEATTLGFIKNMPGECVGYFASGTGFAGICGTSTLLLLKAAGFSDVVIFLSVSPTVILYVISWTWLDRQARKYPQRKELVASDDTISENDSLSSDPILAGENCEGNAGGFEQGVSDNK
jgi:hypothetical protein